MKELDEFTERDAEFILDDEARYLMRLLAEYSRELNDLTQTVQNTRRSNARILFPGLILLVLNMFLLGTKLSYDWIESHTGNNNYIQAFVVVVSTLFIIFQSAVLYFIYKHQRRTLKEVNKAVQRKINNTEKLVRLASRVLELKRLTTINALELELRLNDVESALVLLHVQSKYIVIND